MAIKIEQLPDRSEKEPPKYTVYCIKHGLLTRAPVTAGSIIPIRKAHSAGGCPESWIHSSLSHEGLSE